MAPPSFRVYYGHDPRWLARLAEVDLVVLEARGWDEAHLAQLREAGVKLVGYLSPLAWPDWMGPPRWWWGKRERDDQWGAWWMSLRSPGWRFQVSRMWRELRPLVDGLFLDNLDRLEQDPDSLRPLLHVLGSMRKAWPDVHLIGNRGFAHLPALRRYLDGVLFENLTDRAFSKADQTWVEEKLLELQGTQVYALDYETRRMKEAARRLRERFTGLSYYCAPDEGLQSIT